MVELSVSIIAVDKLHLRQFWDLSLSIMVLRRYLDVDSGWQGKSEISGKALE